MTLSRFLVFGLACAALACGNDDSAPADSGGSSGAGAQGGTGGGSGGSAGDGGTGGTAGSGGSGGAAGAAPCSEDPATLPAGAVCVLEVRGSVADENDQPIGALLTSVCGSICYYGETDASGDFSVLLGAHVVPGEYSVAPHGRPSRAGFYFQLPLDAEGPVVEMGALPLVSMPATGPTIVVKTDRIGAPAQRVTSGDVTLDVAAGILIELDVEDVAAGDEGKRFLTTSVSAAKRDQLADPALGLVALYAFAPFESSFVNEADDTEAEARLEFANTAGLPADAAVEVLALGTYIYPEWVPPATFAPVATAHVSSDGANITLDPGEGIRHLTWVGLREKTR